MEITRIVYQANLNFTTKFQWSHFFSEMEIKDKYDGIIDYQNVSMEPLLFRNGNH